MRPTVFLSLRFRKGANDALRFFLQYSPQEDAQSKSANVCDWLCASLNEGVLDKGDVKHARDKKIKEIIGAVGGTPSKAVASSAATTRARPAAATPMARPAVATPPPAATPAVPAAAPRAPSSSQAIGWATAEHLEPPPNSSSESSDE